MKKKKINNISNRQYLLLTSFCFILNIIIGISSIIYKKSNAAENFYFELTKNILFSKMGICILIVSSILLLLIITILFCKSGCLGKERRILYSFSFIIIIINIICIIYEIIYSFKISTAPSELENAIIWTKHFNLLTIAFWINIVVSAFSVFMFLFEIRYFDRNLDEMTSKKTNYKFFVLLLTPLFAFGLFFYNEKKEMIVDLSELIHDGAL